mmetsp:Transcript_75533/g.161821  ORF Transcript_75533/g.161821 Transcript_75533/m.161821 type:complete len:326 (-) Transcript_75533:406-1383(-)
MHLPSFCLCHLGDADGEVIVVLHCDLPGVHAAELRTEAHTTEDCIQIEELVVVKLYPRLEVTLSLFSILGKLPSLLFQEFHGTGIFLKEQAKELRNVFGGKHAAKGVQLRLISFKIFQITRIDRPAERPQHLHRLRLLRRILTHATIHEDGAQRLKCRTLARLATTGLAHLDSVLRQLSGLPLGAHSALRLSHEVQDLALARPILHLLIELQRLLGRIHRSMRLAHHGVHIANHLEHLCLRLLVPRCAQGEEFLVRNLETLLWRLLQHKAIDDCFQRRDDATRLPGPLGQLQCRVGLQDTAVRIPLPDHGAGDTGRCGRLPLLVA